MSIVAQYARLSADQLAVCIKNPEPLRSCSIDHLVGAEALYLDQYWQPIAWLLSPRRRLEDERLNLWLDEAIAEKRLKEHMVAMQQKSSFIHQIVSLFVKEEKNQKSLPKDTEPLKQNDEDGKERLRRIIDETPIDLPLVAIEGRTKNREERLKLNFGKESVPIFPPEEVSKLNTVLAALGISDIEKNYDPELMDRMRVWPVHWVEEGRDLLESDVIANFLRLQSFYASAAQNHQIVVVWFE